MSQLMDSFTHALVRTPAENMGAGLTTQTLGAPDFALAREQYAAYLDTLKSCSLEVTVLPSDARYADGHFVEDTAVIYGDLAVITRPGAASRQGETEAIDAVLPQKQRAYVTGEGCVDGGDVLFCADRILIGLSARTNRTGAEQLRAALRDYDAELRVDLVNFSGVLHLKSSLTQLAPGVLLRAPNLQSDYDFSFAETLMLPAEESYAVNILPVNEAVLIVEGFPTVRDYADRYYTQIYPLAMSEFEKMDGGLTCLSLRYTL